MISLRASPSMVCLVCLKAFHTKALVSKACSMQPRQTVGRKEGLANRKGELQASSEHIRWANYVAKMHRRHVCFQTVRINPTFPTVLQSSTNCNQHAVRRPPPPSLQSLSIINDLELPDPSLPNSPKRTSLPTPTAKAQEVALPRRKP